MNIQDFTKKMKELMNNSLRVSRALKILLVVFIFSFGYFCGKKGEEIERIGNYSMTTQDFEEYYDTNVERMTRLLNIDKKSLSRFLCEPEDRVSAQIREQLMPDKSYRRYRDIRMVEQVAKEDGFQDRPSIQKIVDHTVIETIAQLYLQEKMEKYVKVSTEDKEAKCDEMRKQDPKNVGPMPYDDCLRLAERYIASELQRKYEPVLIEEIKERVHVKKNEKFDKENYLNNNVASYKSLKRVGGCETSPEETSPKSENNTEEGKKK